MTTNGALLDTNVLVWILLNEEHRISRAASRELSRQNVQCFVSVVSIWEVLVKRFAGKLLIREDPETIVNTIRSSEAWRILPLEIGHIQSFHEIDRFSDHTDPFDRMLIAQAKREGFRIITADPQFERYRINVVW